MRNRGEVDRMDPDTRNVYQVWEKMVIMGHNPVTVWVFCHVSMLPLLPGLLVRHLCHRIPKTSMKRKRFLLLLPTILIK